MIFGVIVVFLVACDHRVYTRDGVTDGDTFYLAEYAHYDNDPVLQAWVAYSLDLSHCQLRIGGPNPARNHNFDCELGARATLIDRYAELTADTAAADGYLVSLTEVQLQGFMDEYVWTYLRHRDWEKPQGLDLQAFRQWRKSSLKNHRPERRIIGSWNYKAIGTQPSGSAD